MKEVHANEGLRMETPGRSQLPLGLTLALVLMASIRERVELSDVPSIARGLALNFCIAGFLSLAFMGFAGLFSA